MLLIPRKNPCLCNRNWKEPMGQACNNVFFGEFHLGRFGPDIAIWAYIILAFGFARQD